MKSQGPMCMGAHCNLGAEPYLFPQPDPQGTFQKEFQFKTFWQ